MRCAERSAAGNASNLFLEWNSDRQSSVRLALSIATVDSMAPEEGSPISSGDARDCFPCCNGDNFAAREEIDVLGCDLLFLIPYPKLAEPAAKKLLSQWRETILQTC
jgi:hypothetical protein